MHQRSLCVIQLLTGLVQVSDTAVAINPGGGRKRGRFGYDSFKGRAFLRSYGKNLSIPDGSTVPDELDFIAVSVYQVTVCVEAKCVGVYVVIGQECVKIVVSRNQIRRSGGQGFCREE